MDAKVGVQGLAEFNRGLRQLDKDAPKALRLAFNDSASLLIDRVKPKIPSVTGKARNSLKAKSTRTSARVSVGGTNARYYPWLDFGGEGRIKGHPAKRDFIKQGRYVYPTLVDIRPDILDDLNERLRDVARDAGLAVD